MNLSALKAAPVKLLAVAAASALALAGCSNDANNGESDKAAGGDQASTIELANGYCKAKGEHTGDVDHGGHEGHGENTDMTACFGDVTNNGDSAVTITGWTSTAFDDGARFEIHEVVDGKMAAKEKITIEPGATHQLAPGGEHLMVLDAHKALEAGSKVAVVLELEDGSEYTVDLPVNEQPAGNEDYAG